MAKIKTSFFCQACGNESPKWTGQCPSCKKWNTIVEEIMERKKETDYDHWKEEHQHRNKIKTLNEIANEKEARINLHDKELHRVLGNGLVKGSVSLVAGEPGIGKSTLFLQMCLQMKAYRCLYISGEESLEQIKLRAERIGLQNENFYLLTETNTQSIFNEIKKLKPEIVVIDSIQTLQTPYVESTAGSVTQVRECTAEFIRFAKATQTPVFIIGHITKEGSIAGPKVLEHMVDTVLQFEGDRHYAYRILRTSKNRFGSASELGIYEMYGQGLREVSNPSEILISQKDQFLSGTSVAAGIEGARALLIETQALVSPSVYGTPQRTTSGFDLRRLQLLLAVLEKRGGFSFGNKDVFLNLAGGIRIDDPGMDLSILASLLSSLEDIAVNPKFCFAGEVGLSGEIRAVHQIEQRIREAEKLGFEKIFISKFNKSEHIQANQIEIIRLSQVDQLYKMLF